MTGGALDHAPLCGIQPEGPEWRLRALTLSLVGRTDLPYRQPSDNPFLCRSRYPRSLRFIDTVVTPPKNWKAR